MKVNQLVNNNNRKLILELQQLLIENDYIDVETSIINNDIHVEHPGIIHEVIEYDSHRQWFYRITYPFIEKEPRRGLHEIPEHAVKEFFPACICNQLARALRLKFGSSYRLSKLNNMSISKVPAFNDTHKYPVGLLVDSDYHHIALQIVFDKDNCCFVIKEASLRDPLETSTVLDSAAKAAEAAFRYSKTL